MSASDDRHVRLAAASNPRRASAADAPELSRLFAAAFVNDPVMDWVARRDAKRAVALEHFFFWLLTVRAVPFGEVWMADGAAAIWLPPGVPATAGGLVEQLRLLPMFLGLCGVTRLLRGQAIADAMEKHHPAEPHFYLAFVAVAPPLQGSGLGSAILAATLARPDSAGLPAYLENSNPKNTPLYARHGFATRANIAPPGAPPLLAMWRNPQQDRVQGSSSLSQ